MKTKLITATRDLENIIAYCARVSNPKNQDNPNIEKLLTYCTKHGHWSVFEMADVTIEIETSRAIAAQILRHRSFSFQEFSQRYSNDLLELEVSEARRQDTKNRQNSIDDLHEVAQTYFRGAQKQAWKDTMLRYATCQEEGIAKECARMLLPLGTKTRLYMKGSVRSWMHYLIVRCHESTQKEHRDIAESIKAIFASEFPLIHKLIERAIKQDLLAKKLADMSDEDLKAALNKL